MALAPPLPIACYFLMHAPPSSFPPHSQLATPKLQQTQPQLVTITATTRKTGIVTDQKVSRQEGGVGTHIATEGTRNRRGSSLLTGSLTFSRGQARLPFGGRSPLGGQRLPEPMLLFYMGHHL